MRSQTLTQIFKNTSESNTVTPHGGTKANTCKTSVITRLSFPKTPADVVNNLPSLTYLGFPGGSAVKNTPAMQETWVSSLGWEDPLEKEMESHSSILAWRIPWAEEPGGLQSMGSQKNRTELSKITTTNVYIYE